MDGTAAALQALAGRVADPALHIERTTDESDAGSLRSQNNHNFSSSSQSSSSSSENNSNNSDSSSSETQIGDLVATVVHSKSHREQAKAILALHFEESTDLTSAAINYSHGVCDPKTGKANDYLVFGCTDEKDQLQVTAVCLVRNLPCHGLKVLEIVWYGTLTQGKGWGSRFFPALVALAKEQLGVDAILSTSTNAALPFWLSRPNIRIVDTVLRASKRCELPSLNKGFKVAPAPINSVMARLYTEQVMRNKKGRLVSQFDGRPYQYCVETSNHVWYVLNPKLSIPTRVRKQRM